MERVPQEVALGYLEHASAAHGRPSSWSRSSDRSTYRCCWWSTGAAWAGPRRASRTQWRPSPGHQRLRRDQGELRSPVRRAHPGVLRGAVRAQRHSRRRAGLLTSGSPTQGETVDARDRDPLADLCPRGAAGVPDLTPQADSPPGIAGLDHLARRPDQALHPGPHPVAAQEADPEADLRYLDHDAERHRRDAPARREHEEGEEERADEQHRPMLWRMTLGALWGRARRRTVGLRVGAL